MTPGASIVTSGLRFHATPWSLGVAAVLVALVVGVAVATARRSGFRPAILALEALRVAIAVLVAFLLNQPEWVMEERPREKPPVVVLVDASRSMDRPDVRPQDGGAPRSRRDSVAALADPAFFAGLAERYSIRVETVGAPAAAEGAAAGTDLHAPLESVVRRHPGLRAVVLASDGDWNQGAPPVQAVGTLRAAGVPLFAVPAGSVVPLPDLAVSAVDGAVTGVVGKPFRVPFTIQSTMPREETVNVTVEASDGQTFARTVRVAPMGRTEDAVLWTPASVGEYTVTVRLPERPEEADPGNNTRSIPVSIREERLRVLIVETLPRWEFRYLRNALSRDPGVEHSTLLFHRGLARPGGGSRDSIDRFPGTIQELSEYDVVFLGDVGVDDGQLTEEDCRLLRELVEFQASGIVFMPGWLGHELSLESTALGDLLPVVLDASRPEGTGTPIPGRFALTERGEASLLSRLADSREENAAVWESLPGFQWYAPVVRAKAGSEVLAVHDDAGNAYGRIPLLVTRPFGAGKVLFMATDGAWRWRKGVEDRYHYRFWGQVVRWMAYRRSMQKGERMRLLHAPEQPEPGQVVALDANVVDAAGEPLQLGTVTVTVESPGGDVETVRLVAPGEQGAWGVFSGNWTPREPGSHAVTLACAETGDRLEGRIFVQGVPGEAIGGPARPEVLEELARLSRGAVTRPEALSELPGLLAGLPEPAPEARRSRLWAHPLALALLVGMLGVFWAGRKWQGLF